MTEDRHCKDVGVTEPCACTDGRQGEQLCTTDGTLGSCDCGSVGGAPSTDSGGSTSGQAGSRAGSGNSEARAGDGAGGSGTSVTEEGGVGTSGATETSDGNIGGADNGAGAAGAGAEAGGGPCGVGDAQGCRCADYVLGHRDCESGSFGACNCRVTTPEPAAAGCVPKTEICNQVDDDCDGLVDEHFVCRDSTVKNTRPYSRGVYLKASTSSTCGSDVAQRFWPTLDQNHVNGLDCSNEYWFADFDDRLYRQLGTRVYRKNSVGETKLSVPPCGSRFGFDQEGVVYYVCGHDLLRGDGEILTGSIASAVAVLNDGRTIVTRRGPVATTQYVVLDRDGNELVRFPPYGMFSGSVGIAPLASSTAGDAAYVAINRTYVETVTQVSEVMVYEIDPDSVFRLVRRVVVPSLPIRQLVISDGTVFVLSTGGATNITAYHPDNTNSVVWHSADSPFFNLPSFGELMAGPLTPVLDP
ncbi:MAG TPA: hypothetical protein VHB79_33395 [Polyangiaceae bacterium]|nr:hypothetical protein [Polyangiaceae bacterium]